MQIGLTKLVYALVGLTCLLYGVSGKTLHAEEGGNLLLLPGVKITADSVHQKYIASNVADGNDIDKNSRWVSADTPCPHWLMFEFPNPITFNRIAIKFWNKGFVPVDFDLQIKTSNGWQTFKSVRDNSESYCIYTFDSQSSAGVRVIFTQTVPDNHVRIYEAGLFQLQVPVEGQLSDAFSGGLLAPEGKRATLRLHNYSPHPESLQMDLSLLSLWPMEKEVLSREISLSPEADTEVILPLPSEYGSFAYVVKDKEGKNILRQRFEFMYIPVNKSSYRSSSPFGAHYLDVNSTMPVHAGLRWLRNHDSNGPWYLYDDGEKPQDWSRLRDRFEFVKKYDVRECFVFLGAPRPYSTILPGEITLSKDSNLYSYYPPADFSAWTNRYLEPVARMLIETGHFRAYEIWNEAWSYYRLRGLHGTAAEACEIFRVSYDALKKTDPQSLAYATDVKAEAVDNRYAFKSFGRDLLDLGYLRYSDLLSMHGYGMENEDTIERLLKNAWDYGCDYDIWCTETASAGKPYYTLMERLTAYRSYGFGKTFIYNSARHAPLVDERGVLTMNMVGLAALLRVMGDGLPLGIRQEDGVRQYFFANGDKAVALFFSDSDQPVQLPASLSGCKSLLDIFGREVAPGQAVLSRENPLLCAEVPLEMAAAAMGTRLEQYAGKSDEQSSAILRDVSARISGASVGELKAAFEREFAGLDQARTGATGEMLYGTNKALDLLTNFRILLARRDKETVDAPSIDELEKRLRSQRDAITVRTDNNAVLLNTERLNSRARKQIQFARMYADDGDRIACNLYLNRAAVNLAEAERRLPDEQIGNVYKTKLYFRSQKRFIRSETYCFPNGRPQEAVITLGNPFNKTLRGTLTLSLPAGWKADTLNLPYEVGPQSRQLLTVQLTAPDEFTPEEIKSVALEDKDGNFPAIKAECEIVKTVPPFPVLRGGLSTGTFTGN